MTLDEFNIKYKNYLEEGQYGLSFENEEFINWLDSKFEELIKNPLFTYSQIKCKFGVGRFYCTNAPTNIVEEIENKITLLAKRRNLL